MALSDAQLTKLAQQRKENPPGYYAAATQTVNSIVGETEDAIILATAQARTQAAAYFDQLSAASPQSDDNDAITARAATQSQANIDASLAELEPVLMRFETFRDELTGTNTDDTLAAIGMQPLLQSINGGIAAVRLRVEALRFARKFSLFATAKYGGKVTADQRKEWRSWKRILVSYP